MTDIHDHLVEAFQDAVAALVHREERQAVDALRAARITLTHPGLREDIPRKTYLRIFHRDSFTCSYCEKRTIFLPVLRALSTRFPDEVPYTPSWASPCHPIYMTHSATLDHVVPVAKGGNSKDENLVTACYQCQDIKGDWMIEALPGWELHNPRQSSWAGLSDLYPDLCRVLHLEKERYHKEWLTALHA